MTMQDNIADMASRIRNASLAKLLVVDVPYSKMKANILDVMLQEGYILSYNINEDGNKKFISINLKYIDNGVSVISEIKRVSKPSCRIYTSLKKLKPVKNGYGINILSTDSGVISDRKARQSNIGGELLLTIF